MLQKIKKDLKKYASKERAEINAWFFKTKKGQYGHGDIFLGIKNGDARSIALKYSTSSFFDIEKLLKSRFHEERFVALEILVLQFEKAQRQKDLSSQKKIVFFYLKNIDRVNNWDLVDTSASYILGAYFFSRDRKIIFKLLKSKSIWDRRIAIITTHYFIKQNDFSDTFKMTIFLLNEKEDLIQKALGWMLREIGKQDEKSLTNFLDEYKSELPRTTLRYAIEKFPENIRREYLKR